VTIMIALFLVFLAFLGLVLQLPDALAPSPGAMDAKAVLVISGAVVLLVQLVKWGGLPDSRGPWAVLACSLLGVLFWGWSRGDMARATAFDYFAGFVSVAAAAAGVFGFTRAMPQAVTATSEPPSGAGSNPTAKP
jgi:hypothetical protein